MLSKWNVDLVGRDAEGNLIGTSGSYCAEDEKHAIEQAIDDPAPITNLILVTVIPAP